MILTSSGGAGGSHCDALKIESEAKSSTGQAPGYFSFQHTRYSQQKKVFIRTVAHKTAGKHTIYKQRTHDNPHIGKSDVALTKIAQKSYWKFTGPRSRFGGRTCCWWWWWWCCCCCCWWWWWWWRRLCRWLRLAALQGCAQRNKRWQLPS
jgi:hypothetical protein